MRLARKNAILAVVTWLMLSVPAFAFQDKNRWAVDFFKPDPGKSEGFFPLAPRPLPPELNRRIQAAERIEQIFKPVRIIPLEFTQSTALDKVKRAIFWGNAWVILSNDGEVFRFSTEGAFMSRIGAKGKGPGEYGNAFQIRVTPDGKLAVLDVFMGRILIYQPDGHYLRNIDFRLEVGRINPGFDFIWTKDSLFLASPRTAGVVLPYGILNFVNGTMQPSHGFGEHVIPFHEAPRGSRVNPYAHNGFEMVGGRIWATMPYDIDIQVYDSEGRWLAELPKRIANALHREDFEDFDVRSRGAGKLFKSMMRQRRNSGLVVCGRFVLSGLTAGNTGMRTWYLYDDHGNLLKAELANDLPFHFLVGSLNGQLVGSHGPEYMDYFFPRMSRATQTLYKASGYDPKNPHDNPVLVLGSLN